MGCCAKQGISPTSKDVHQLYLLIMALALPVFIAVEALLIWCIVRYRKRDDSLAARSVGGNRSLVVFFTIPAVIVAMLFPFGEQTLMKLEKQTTPQVRIKVEGFQWEWTFLYLSEGDLRGRADRFRGRAPDARGHGASRRRARGDRAHVA